MHTRAIARLELPVNPVHDATVLYRATAHRRPVFNGYSGYFAPHYWALQYLLDQHDPARADAALGVRTPRGGDRSRSRRRRRVAHVRRQPSAGRAGPRGGRLHDVSHPARAPVGPLPKIEGEPLPIASISAAANAALVGAMTDHDIITRWHAGREQRPGDSMTVDLGQPRTVHGAETLIAGYVADFPRQLSIETSLDGQVWSPAWSGGTAIMALSAALEDPLNVPLPFPFEPRSARYLRFTQTGVEGTSTGRSPRPCRREHRRSELSSVPSLLPSDPHHVRVGRRPTPFHRPAAVPSRSAHADSNASRDVRRLRPRLRWDQPDGRVVARTPAPPRRPDRKPNVLSMLTRRRPVVDDEDVVVGGEVVRPPGRRRHGARKHGELDPPDVSLPIDGNQAGREDQHDGRRGAPLLRGTRAPRARTRSPLQRARPRQTGNMRRGWIEREGRP